MIPFLYRGKHRKKRHPNQFYVPLVSLLILLFCFSSFMVVRQLLQEQQEKNAFAGLSLLAEQEEGDDHAAQALYTDTPYIDTLPLHTGLSEPPQEKAILSQYAELYARNSDLTGWLSIKNAGIDLPVMLTPDEPEYYLRRGFDRESTQSGTPFIGVGADEDSDCFIIHGHKMKNKTMFGTLDYYEDNEFWKDNKTISFNTLYEQRNYEIFAVLKTRVLYTNEAGLRYSSYSGELTKTRYKELIDWLTAQSEYDTGIVPVEGEQILLLSTCSYHTPNGRFVVATRRVE